MDKHVDCQHLLDKLTKVLRQHNAWQEIAPSPEALASSLPFALDTLSATQWLQWVFIPNMQYLLDRRQALPAHLELSSYMEETLQAESGGGDILTVTRELDHLFKAEA